jgi:hypothetical protein
VKGCPQGRPQLKEKPDYLTLIVDKFIFIHFIFLDTWRCARWYLAREEWLRRFVRRGYACFCVKLY